jgi:alkanesulfonate monooxygenase SsuD/methylene tetrahydromethanopterin reductase-like flavin-dependent oxidoreductase (luciferase family)
VKIGLFLPMGENAALGGYPRYRDLRDQALAAEHAGLDSVYVYDHLMFHHEGQERAGCWEGWTVWAALAEATQRVELGALVLCTAFRNPALLAKMAVTLDEVSDGRVVLGIGAGWHKPEFDAFGYPFDHLASRFEEALQIIAPLVREGHVDFQGEFEQANDCEMIPPPSRPIPILVGASRPRMLRLTARYADAWNTCWHGDVTAIEEPVANLRTACEEVGRSIDDIAITAGVQVAIGDLADLPEGSDNEMRWIVGSDEEIAAKLRAYQDQSVSELMVRVNPLTVDGVTRLGQIVEHVRG